MVYDVMEVLRAFIERALYDFEINSEGDKSMKEWCKYCSVSWKNIKIWHKRFHVQLVDAIDFYVSSLANVFRTKNIEHLWVPKIILKK